MAKSSKKNHRREAFATFACSTDSRHSCLCLDLLGLGLHACNARSRRRRRLRAHFITFGVTSYLLFHAYYVDAYMYLCIVHFLHAILQAYYTCYSRVSFRSVSRSLYWTSSWTQMCMCASIVLLFLFVLFPRGKRGSASMQSRSIAKSTSIPIQQVAVWNYFIFRNFWLY